MEATLKLGKERREFKKFVPLAFGGHCFYTRQCTRYPVNKDGMPEIKGIVLPDRVKDWTSQVEVLAIGARVGQERSIEHRTKYDCKRPGERDPIDRGLGPKRYATVVEVGDIIMCPCEHAGIKRSPLADDEYFIEESTPYFIIRE